MTNREYREYIDNLGEEAIGEGFIAIKRPYPNTPPNHNEYTVLWPNRTLACAVRWRYLGRRRGRDMHDDGYTASTLGEGDGPFNPNELRAIAEFCERKTKEATE